MGAGWAAWQSSARHLLHGSEVLTSMRPERKKRIAGFTEYTLISMTQFAFLMVNVMCDGLRPLRRVFSSKIPKVTD
jgi:hypothetical protein